MFLLMSVILLMVDGVCSQGVSALGGVCSGGCLLPWGLLGGCLLWGVSALGVSAPRGVSAPGECLLWGMSALGGVCSGTSLLRKGVSAPRRGEGSVYSGGVCLLWGLSAPGGIPACTEAYTPPLGSRAQHTVNEQPVCILLECIFVYDNFWKTPHENEWLLTSSVSV